MTQQQYYVQQTKPSNGMAVAALVLGIVTLVLAFVTLNPFTIIVGNFLVFPTMIMAIAFGHVGYKTSRTSGVGGGAAVAGFVLGYVTVAVFLIANFIAFLMAISLS